VLGVVCGNAEGRLSNLSPRIGRFFVVCAAIEIGDWCAELDICLEVLAEVLSGVRVDVVEVDMVGRG